MSPPVAGRTLQLGSVKDPELQLLGHLGHRVLMREGRRARVRESREDTVLRSWGTQDAYLPWGLRRASPAAPRLPPPALQTEGLCAFST